MSTKYVMVPVPEEQVADVMRLIVRKEGARPSVSPLSSSNETEHDSHEETDAAYANMKDDDIRDAYKRGRALRRRILTHLANHAEVKFRFPQLASAVGVGSHALPGSLGRFAVSRYKRYNGRRPYHIFVEGSDRTKWVIWMDRRVAQIILELAEQTS